MLDRLREREPTSRLGYLAEQVDSWYGYALLLEDSTDAALQRLRRAVSSMRRSERMHELPTAAVYLAEAEWRAGDEDAADRAADVALEAARRQGSNHMLLQALADFPAVVTRRLDAEPAADSPWHELGRSLIAQGIALGASVATSSTLLVEFGRCALLVDGQEQRPRIAKSYELLAYLATTRPAWQADRDTLLDALFDGRADDAARAYLRQAVRWLRHVLGDDRVTVQDGSVRVLGGDAIATESRALRGRARRGRAAARGRPPERRRCSRWRSSPAASTCPASARSGPRSAAGGSRSWRPTRATRRRSSRSPTAGSSRRARSWRPSCAPTGSGRPPGG